MFLFIHHNVLKIYLIDPDRLNQFEMIKATQEHFAYKFLKDAQNFSL